MKFHVRPGEQVAEVEASIALLSCRNLTGRCSSVVLWAGICLGSRIMYLVYYCTNARASVEGWPPRGAPVALAVSSCPGQFALYPAISRYIEVPPLSRGRYLPSCLPKTQSPTTYLYTRYKQTGRFPWPRPFHHCTLCADAPAVHCSG